MANLHLFSGDLSFLSSAQELTVIHVFLEFDSAFHERIQYRKYGSLQDDRTKSPFAKKSIMT